MASPFSISVTTEHADRATAVSNGTIILRGWQAQPNLRGTIDIIWACILVIFTCVWTVLHINIPAPSEPYRSTLLRKLRWAAAAAFSPEILTTLAAGQRFASMASAKYLRRQGHIHWTIVHSFYADSGGFYLHVPEEPGYPPFPPFPINSRAIAYLVERGHLQIPSITREHIEDKSKADKFAKVFAVIQTSYLIVECIARRAQSLAITPLELTTLAFVPCTLATYYLWMDKPLGVNTSTTIYTNKKISEILEEAGPLANKQWRDTPLDFVEDHTLFMASDIIKPPQPALLKDGRLVGWNSYARRPRFAHFGNLDTRPISRIPNDYTPAPSSYAHVALLWALPLLGEAIHLLAWNFVFPTRIELWTWRICCLTMFGASSVGYLGNVRAAKPGMHFRFQLACIWVKPALKEGIFWKYGMDVPGNICTALYNVAKLGILVLAWSSLRALPETAYDTVNWTGFIPHV